MDVDPPPQSIGPTGRRRRAATVTVATGLALAAALIATGSTADTHLAAGAAVSATPGAGSGTTANGAAPRATPRAGTRTGATTTAAGAGTTGSTTVGAATTTTVPAAALQTRLDAIRAKYSVPGVSVTIIWPDGTTWTGVSGRARIAGNIPVVPNTAFSIGSVSKTFLAAVILQLQEEHRLSLNDRILTWLPHAKASSGVTIREMLDHTSGLYDFFANSRIDTAILADKRAHWTASRALAYMRGPYCHSGRCWHYSNSNYVILGQLVQRVTGHSAAVEIRRRFLDPLALGRTFAQGIESRRGTVATSYRLVGPYATSHAYSWSDGTAISPWTSVVTAAGDAGDMAASSVDLAHWARALYAGTVLQPASLAAMLDVRHSVAVGSHFPYGLAMFQVTIDGHRTVGHDGRLEGARSSIRYMPDTGITIAVATNQDRIGPDVFGSSLLKIAMAPSPPPPPPPPPDPSSSAAEPSGEPSPSGS